jgi:hypothetical protein
MISCAIVFSSNLLLKVVFVGDSLEQKFQLRKSFLTGMARQVFDTVNMQGVYCNLHTGQEKKDVPFSSHLACTVEMCYLTRQWKVAVIDEIQVHLYLSEALPVGAQNDLTKFIS